MGTPIAELLSSYVATDRLHAMFAGREPAPRQRGSVLFADISGFTPLTEELAQRLGVRRGGEELTRHLNAVYGGLIDEVHSFRGSITGFAGDAIACWFEGARHGARAVAAALRLQNVIARHREPAFEIKVAVSSGEAMRFAVGDARIQLLDVLTGSAVACAARCEGLAAPGEIVADAETVRAISSLEIARELSGQDAAVVRGLGVVPPPSPWRAVGAALNEDRLRPWVLPAVFERLSCGQGEFLAEVRQAVALFVRFGGLDFESDAAAPAKLDAYVRWTQRVLEGYGGALIQLTTGDGDKGSYLYATFGAPLAHEDMSERALAAALTLREPPPELSFVASTQIGVSRGRMRTGAYGSAQRRTYGALGDETNVAARLMARAQPGQVIVSERIAATGGFRFRPLGDAILKGKKEPLALFELAGRPQAPRAPSGRPIDPIVGRADERASLRRGVDALVRQREGAVFVLEGEAGIGKSRLASDVLEYAGAQRVRSLVAHADAIERATPFYGWRRVFAELLGIDDPEVTQTRLYARLPKALLPLAPLLGPAVGARLADTPASAQLAGAERVAKTFEFLAKVFVALVAPAPALLLVEDVHWLDSSSWALLERIRRDAGAPLMIVLTCRPIPAAERVDGVSNVLDASSTRRLRLDALAPEDVIALVTRSLGVSRLPDAAAALIREKAEGNPFFAQEIGYSLRDSGVLRMQDGECTLAGEIDRAQFPDAIEGVVMSRIDRLTPQQQLALKVASVIGRVFTIEMLRDIYPVKEEPGALAATLDTLARLDLTPRAPDGCYVFKHAVTTEVAYNSMLFEQRRRLHAAVVQWYERVHATDLAPHYACLAHHHTRAVEGAVALEEEALRGAIDALVKAGKQSLEQGATPEAVAHLRKGLSFFPSLDAATARDATARALELDLRSSLGAALAVALGPTHVDVQREFVRSRELCQEAGETARLFEAMFGLWYAHLTAAERAGAVEFAAHLLDVAEAADDPALRSLAAMAAGATAICEGRHAEGLMHLERAASIHAAPDASGVVLSRVRNPVVMAHCFYAWAHWFLGYPDRAVADIDRAIELAAESAHPMALTAALCFGGLVRRQRREVAETAAHVDRAEALAAEHALPYWLGVLWALRGWLTLADDPAAAAADLERMLVRDRDAGVRSLSTITVSIDLIHALTSLGRFGPAEDVVREAREMLGTRLVGFAAPELLRREAELFAARGDDRAAEASFREALRVARSQQAKSLELRAALGQSRLRARTGRPAAYELAEVYDWFSEGHATQDLLDAKAWLDELAARARGGKDLDGLARRVFGRMDRELSPTLAYHCRAHTEEDVLPAALRLADRAGVSAAERQLLVAGVLLHDLGFVARRDGHEEVGAAFARDVLPAYGFAPSEIDVVVGVVRATKIPQSPRTLLEQLMADADLDVLGRDDFLEKNAALRAELAAEGVRPTDELWYSGQLNFLERHAYFTAAARELRGAGKERNLAEMRRRLHASRSE